MVRVGLAGNTVGGDLGGRCINGGGARVEGAIAVVGEDGRGIGGRD